VISDDLLQILACPACHAKLALVRDRWLVCQNDGCRRKYPIEDGIPVLLVDEGDKYVELDVEELPD
jgi:uncharacterized protein YbaR (Trm112 family)